MKTRRKKDKGKENKGFIYKIAWAFAIIAILLSIGYAVLVVINISSAASAEQALLSQMKNAIGDLIAGTVGVCLSFSTTLFLFITFREQRKQFDETRKDSRREQFETTFFNMLAMLYEVRRNINTEISNATDGKEKGLKDVFLGFRNYYNGHTSSSGCKEVDRYLSKKSLNTVEFEKAEQYMGKIYEDYMADKTYDVGYYFRFVFNLINFVIDNWEEQVDSDTEIPRYLSMIQAQMSNDELGLIFYDAVSSHGLDKNYEQRFKENIDRYGFLENISDRTLMNRSHHHIYPGTIFKFLNRDERKLKEKFKQRE